MFATVFQEVLRMRKYLVNIGLFMRGFLKPLRQVSWHIPDDADLELSFSVPSARDCVAAVQKRLQSKNANVQLYSLSVSFYTIDCGFFNVVTYMVI
jgi:hypothetical protein